MTDLDATAHLEFELALVPERQSQQWEMLDRLVSELEVAVQGLGSVAGHDAWPDRALIYMDVDDPHLLERTTRELGAHVLGHHPAGGIVRACHAAGQPWEYERPIVIERE